MSKQIKRVTVTGGAGQIAYSLLFRIANGDMLGKEQPISLCIADIPDALDGLCGVKMELEDCAFPLLHEVIISTDVHKAFEETNYALLVGAKPRGAGMARADLLAENGKIFVTQGRALNEVAHRDVLVLVVGNPCNTNCLIAMSQAPRLNRANFHAMTRLDQNRAMSLLAQKAETPVTAVTRMTIWGNHSSTQVPDFFHAQINGAAAVSVIADQAWLEREFIQKVQNRGAAIIAARGKSSAASAASSILDAIKALTVPTAPGDWFSTALCSDGNPYGIADNLIFSFPCRSDGKGKCEIFPGLEWNAFLEKKIHDSERELLEERAMVLY